MLRVVAICAVALGCHLIVAADSETTCPIAEAPENGFVQLSEEPPKVGTLAFYYCNDGATLFGASTSKCLSSGDWMFDPPICLRSCNVPKIQDGELGRNHWKNRQKKQFVSLQDGESVKHHELVILRCRDGFSAGIRTNDRSQEVECIDGVWSEPLQCHPKTTCPIAEAPENGFVQLSEEPPKVGTLAFYSCNDGATLVGASTSKCLSSGDWTFDPPMCLYFCIGQPPPVENGSPVIRSREHGHSVWYRCDPGYNKVKAGYVFCHFGKWEGSAPVCSDSRCYTDEINYPGLIKPTVSFMRHGASFNLECENAYKPASSWKKRVTCEGGKWDISTNPCIISISGCRVNKEEMSHLIVEPEKDYYRLGESILLSCPHGLRLTSEVVRMMCLGETWSDTLPDCVEVTEHNVQ